MARRRSQAGFTMVEVLISIVLCSIAVMGIVGLYRVQTSSSGFSRHVTEATVLAERKLEELRTVATPVTGADIGPVDEMGKTGTGGIFNRNWTVTTVGTYADVVVTVGWTEGTVPRTVTVRGRRTL